jgi:hypothetical protein
MDTVEGCAECSRLAEAYESETMAWFRLEGQLRIAEYARDEVTSGKIAAELDKVAKRRVALRAEMDRHRAEFHANGGNPKARTVCG